MTVWGCLGFWKCRSHRERVRHSPSMCTGSFPGGSCRCCWPGTLLGATGPSWVYGCRLSPSFLYELAWYFFFFPPSSFSFSTSGEQNQPSIYWWKWLFQTSHVPSERCWKTKLVLVWSHKETAGNLLSIKSTRYCHWCEQGTDFMLATWETFTHPMAKREVIRLICGQMKR